MSNKEHILISLESRHAENIFSGRKKIELRRRKMHVAPGDMVLIYVKIPVGSLVGHVTITAVHASSPKAIWRRYGKLCGLKRTEFFDYFSGSDLAFALFLEDAKRFPTCLSLKDIRRVSSGFQPPQFFTRLQANDPLLHAVKGYKAA